MDMEGQLYSVDYTIFHEVFEHPRILVYMGWGRERGESRNQSYQPFTTYTDGGLYLSSHLQQHCVSCPVTFTLGSWRGKRLFNSTTNP